MNTVGGDCSTCKFFHFKGQVPTGDQELSGDINPGEPFGECRIQPPNSQMLVLPIPQGPSIMNPVGGQKQGMTLQAFGFWPQVRGGDWCAEYQGKVAQ